MNKRFVVDGTGEVTVITDTYEDADVCIVDDGCEDFAEWVCNALNYWYSITDKYLQISPVLFAVMRQGFDDNVTPEDWVDEQDVE